MLLSFEASNFRSFRAPVRLSLAATRERQHSTRLIGVGQESLLPVAAIWGTNGSGKSNLYRALRYLQRLFLRPARVKEARLGYEPYLLDDGSSARRPMEFRIEFMAGNRVLALSCAIARWGIAAEEFSEIRGGRKHVLFSRNTAEETATPRYDTALLEKRNPSAREIIRFKQGEIWPNQLFLPSLQDKSIPEVDDACAFLTHVLTLMIPDSTLKLLGLGLEQTDGLLQFCNELLRDAGLGADGITLEKLRWEELALTPDTREELEERLQDGQSTFARGLDGARYTITRRGVQMSAARLRTLHHTSDGRTVLFQVSDESEGIQRFLDLLPAWYQLMKSPEPRVFVIDEFDRSLHPLLARRLLGDYLKQAGRDSRKQLIFTTHDAQLLDQELFRRDEIYFAQRNSNADSVIFPLASIPGVRYDKDIRRAYLAGEFGGVPPFADKSTLSP